MDVCCRLPSVIFHLRNCSQAGPSFRFGTIDRESALRQSRLKNTATILPKSAKLDSRLDHKLLAARFFRSSLRLLVRASIALFSPCRQPSKTLSIETNRPSRSRQGTAAYCKISSAEASQGNLSFLRKDTREISYARLLHSCCCIRTIFRTLTILDKGRDCTLLFPSLVPYYRILRSLCFCTNAK